MPRKGFTSVTLLIDRSGSMVNIREGAIAGVNDFYADQKAVPGDGVMSLILFDHEYTPVYIDLPEKDVQPLTPELFVPRGNTALDGAIGRTIDELGARLAALPESERPEKVMLAIMTDGEENASPRHEWSRQYTKEIVNQKIAHQRSVYNWTVLYLGANQDAQAVANDYGIAQQTSGTYQATNQGATTALHCLSRSTRNWKLDGNQSAASLLLDPDPPLDVSVNVQVAVASKS